MKRIGCSLAVAALALAGCGGSSSSSTTTTSTGLSRSDLAAKANALCQSAQAQARAFPAPGPSSTTRDDAVYEDHLVPVIDVLTSQLGALVPDSAAKAEWTAWVTLFTKERDNYDLSRKQLDAGSSKGLDTFIAGSNERLAMKAAARQLGATVCAK